MNKEIIDEALLFYDIEDDKYKLKCYECLEQIEKDSKLAEEFNDIFKILYVSKSNKISELWSIKSLNDLFSNGVHSYITNLLLLSGYKIHKDNFIRYNLDEKQMLIHKKRVKECLLNDIVLRNYNGIRISQMVWGSYFSNIKLIEIGRLQYEKCEDYIKIHIPSNDKLDIDKVCESLRKSKKYIEKYFNMKEFDYHCNSWLLSKQIHTLLDKNTNIFKFYELFNVEDGENCIDDILNFVYQILEIQDYKELKENTTLQKNIKLYLLDRNEIKIGKGVLKRDVLE